MTKRCKKKQKQKLKTKIETKNKNKNKKQKQAKTKETNSKIKKYIKKLEKNVSVPGVFNEKIRLHLEKTIQCREKSMNFKEKHLHSR